MAENEKIDRTFLSSLSSGHSIESLISAPLTAVSKANAMMLGGQVQFILDYCFKEKNGSHEPVMIKMNFSGNTPDGCFYIPLITILPLNNLAVDEVSVKFNVEITTAINTISSIYSRLRTDRGNLNEIIYNLPTKSYFFFSS